MRGTLEPIPGTHKSGAAFAGLAASVAFATFVAAVLAPCGTAFADAPLVAPAGADRLRRVSAALAAERERLHIPGLAVAVVEDDRVTLLDGSGVRSLESGQPVDSETVFPIGSCTKAFTAMAAVISQDDGKLSLDDSPKRVFPWFHMSDPEADRLVTLRDMLSHRTGLLGYADLAAEPGVLSRLEYVRAATAARPAARFREKFQYSNAMYVAAGEIVAKAQGTTWERVIERRIFAPLGMTSSTPSLAEMARLPNRATGYDDADHTGTWRATPPPASIGALAPAGAIASSARDMARWVRFLLAEGTIDGRRVASAAGVREVMTPHIPARNGWWYGLGWAIYDWNGHHVVEHNGGSQGLSALVSLMPDRHLGFVLLANTTPTSLTGITNAGKILWPILTGETAPGEAAARDTTGLPTAMELVARMAAAQGGAANLRRHASLEVRAHKSYPQHGVEADLRTRWEAPDHREDVETWTAAGRRIGIVRTFFDGAHGGQTTTFGQDAAFEGEDLDRARREANLNWPLDPAQAGFELRVVEGARLGEDSVYVLETKSPNGAVTRYSVSSRTFLVLQRTSGSAVETYSDFRSVDGRIWPFHTRIQDQLGEAEVQVRDLQFDRRSPPGSFAAHAP